MLALENADEILQILDRFTKQKSKEIPPELEEYIDYVAKTGDTVYRWPKVQYLFREKLRNVIKEFHDTTASIEDLPQCPNVDQFNYETMKTLLFERFDHFQSAPFTIQRLCELLTAPKKHYSRLDKFMRALEKNILVVSTVEPGRKPAETEENGDDSLNGDILSGIGISIEVNKNVLKVDGEATNGNAKNGTGSVPSDAPEDEVASSSGVLKTENADIEVTNTEKVEQKLDGDNKSTVNEEQDKINDKENEKQEETKSDEDKPIVAVQKESETQKTEKIDESSEVSKDDSTKTTVEEPQKIEEVKEPEKSENIEVTKTETTDIAVEDKPDEVTSEKASPIKETIIRDKPSTPKRACEEDHDEIIEKGEIEAKKIKLDLPESEKKAVDDDKKKSEVINEVPTEVDLPKKDEIIDSISTEIDAQKENELLEEVVDSVLAAEEEVDKEKNDIKDDEPTKENVVVEEVPKVESSIVEEKKEQSITSVTPTTDNNAIQSIKEDEKIVDEPIGTPQDEMTVEENEATPAAAPVSNDPENAMEAAPIKPDEEQMDVDESNSADAMDL